MKQIFKKIKNSKIFNIIISLLIFYYCFLIVWGLYFRYYQIIWLLVIFSFILFLIVRKPKSILRKITLFSIILLFAILTSFLGTISESPKMGVIIANNLQKVNDITTFLEKETKNPYFYSTTTVVDNRGFCIEPNTDNDDFNNLIVALAENNIIDKNVEFIYFDTLFSDNFEITKKRYEKEAKKVVGKIDGIKSFNIDLSNWKDEKNYPVIILNVEIYNNFNQEKIEKTIKNIFISSNLTLNILKSKEANYNWHKKQDAIILKLSKDKKYDEALNLAEKINQKEENSYDISCINKKISIEEKIKKDPKNYQLYIERGKLNAPIKSLFSHNQEIKCDGFFNINDNDTKSAIQDFETALKINPKAYEAYEPIYISYKSLNRKIRKNAIYKEKILEYGIKAAEYTKDEFFYRDVAEMYKQRRDKEKEQEYLKKAEAAGKANLKKVKEMQEFPLLYKTK